MAFGRIGLLQVPQDQDRAAGRVGSVVTEPLPQRTGESGIAVLGSSQAAAARVA